MPALKTVQIDGMGDGHFVFESNEPNLSNEAVVLKANAVEWPSGTVIGKYTSGGDIGKWGALNPAAADGTQTAAGILFNRKAISATDTKGVVVVRKQAVNGNLLTYVNTVTGPQKAAAEAALATAMVMVRY